MAKLYVFAIGGTGSRVLKAFTMLLASGLTLANGFDTVVPIIIDPDVSNGDLTRTKDILRLYLEIRQQIDEPDGFFRQAISAVNTLGDSKKVPEFLLTLKDVKKDKFKDYIDFNALSSNFGNMADDKNFIKLLYSDRNLESNLKVGFKGYPNIGAVVLDQIIDTDQFKLFADSFGPDDAIFIIASIFGGTGAAGFPLLLKNFRGNTALPNFAHIKEAKIGGITYLPYFSLDKNDEIIASAFDEKTKLALKYYDRTIINENQINTLYIIGNREKAIYKYSVGGENQKNKAHFLELAGAMAIFDFCRNIENIGEVTVVKEFGIEKDTTKITFSDLNNKDKDLLFKPLVKFKLYTEYLDKALEKALKYSRWTKNHIWLISKKRQSLLSRDYFSTGEYKNQIEKFNFYFNEWLDEMAYNKPAFVPFKPRMEITPDNALALVNGIAPKKIRGFKEIDKENNALIDKINKESWNITESKRHNALIKLFSQTTEIVLQKQKII